MSTQNIDYKRPRHTPIEIMIPSLGQVQKCGGVKPLN